MTVTNKFHSGKLCSAPPTKFFPYADDDCDLLAATFSPQIDTNEKSCSFALSTALETLEAIDLDSWSGCVAIFAIIPALVTHVPSHAVTYYLLN